MTFNLISWISGLFPRDSSPSQPSHPGRSSCYILTLSQALLLTVLAGFPLQAQPQTTALETVADTHLRQDQPNQNEGGRTYLVISKNPGTRTLVRFDQGDIATAMGSGTLLSASLELYIESLSNDWGSGRTVEAHRLTTDWTELGATMNCPQDLNLANSQPDCSSQWGGGSFNTTPTASVLHTNGLSGWVQFNVTADVQAFLSGTANYGWLLKKTQEGQEGTVAYTSREGNAAQAPRLVLVVDNGGTVEAPPTLRITAPTARALHDNPAPEITVVYSDDLSGVDVHSLQIRVDEGNLTASCNVGPTTAHCISPSLSPGPHTVQAQIQDFSGKQATSQVYFDLLIGEGPHTVALMTPLADALLNQSMPNQNEGWRSYLSVSKGPVSRSLVRFKQAEIASVVSNGTLVSAYLELYIQANSNTWGGGRTVDVHRLTTDWTEKGVTVNCPEDSTLVNDLPDCSPQWGGLCFESDGQRAAYQWPDRMDSVRRHLGCSSFPVGHPQLWVDRQEDPGKPGGRGGVHVPGRSPFPGASLGAGGAGQSPAPGS